VSKAAKLRRQGLVPVGAEEHVRNGLLLGWRFYHVHAAPGFFCWLCGRPAAYVSPSPGSGRVMAMCAKHARDF
jgi:hypothetical protein